VRDIRRDVPLEGRTVTTHDGTWTVHVEGVDEPPADNTWVRFHLRLSGPKEYRMTLIVTLEYIFVLHPRDNPTCILDALHRWLENPHNERGDELLLEIPPT